MHSHCCGIRCVGGCVCKVWCCVTPENFQFFVSHLIQPVHVYERAINAPIGFITVINKVFYKCILEHISLQGHYSAILELHVSHMPRVEVLAAVWHYFFLVDK